MKTKFFVLLNSGAMASYVIDVAEEARLESLLKGLYPEAKITTIKAPLDEPTITLDELIDNRLIFTKSKLVGIDVIPCPILRDSNTVTSENPFIEILVENYIMESHFNKLKMACTEWYWIQWGACRKFIGVLKSNYKLIDKQLYRIKYDYDVL